MFGCCIWSRADGVLGQGPAPYKEEGPEGDRAFPLTRRELGRQGTMVGVDKTEEKKKEEREKAQKRRRSRAKYEDEPEPSPLRGTCGSSMPGPSTSAFGTYYDASRV